MDKRELKIAFAMPSPSSTDGMRMISQMYYDYGVFENPRFYHFDTYYSWGTNKLVRALQSLYQKPYFIYFLLRHRIDVVFVMTSSFWGFYDKAFYCLLARMAGVKSVLNPVGGHFIRFHHKNSFNKFMVPIAMKAPNGVIAGTSFWFKYFNEQFKPKWLKDIPNPVRFKNQVYKPKSEQTIVITFLARLVKEKGTDLFMELARKIHTIYPEIKFVIAGTGERYNFLKEGLKDLCDLAVVEMKGFVDEDEKDRILSATDIYVLPTEFEVLPISILEAMSYGNVVVSTRVGGIPDAVIDGKTGFLTVPTDFDAVLEKVLLVIADEKLRKQIALNSFNWVKANYEFGVVLDKQVNFFEEVYYGRI